ncbi:hypothetical protein ACKWTF_004644 [Chironomus riparius]
MSTSNTTESIELQDLNLEGQNSNLQESPKNPDAISTTEIIIAITVPEEYDLKKICKCFTCCNGKSKVIDFLKFKSKEKFINKSSIISSVLRKNENEKFWDEENLKEVMNTYLEDDNDCLEDFFSILMFDWLEYEKKSNKCYFLREKFNAFKEAFYNPTVVIESNKNLNSNLHLNNVHHPGSSNTKTDKPIQHNSSENQTQDTEQEPLISGQEPLIKGQELLNEAQSSSTSDQQGGSQTPSTSEQIPKSCKIFEKLLKVIKDKNLERYHYTCLKIIYYYADEISKSSDEERTNFSLEVHNIITKVLKIETNDEYKVKILKVLVIFLKNVDTYPNTKKSIKDFLMQKQPPNEDSIFYDLMLAHCDRLFFNLVFSLKEDSILDFKDDYKNYIKTYKGYFGEYWSFAIKENGQLLYLLTKMCGFDETGMFILNETEEAVLKSSITSHFTDVAEFQAIFNKPFNKSDKAKYEELKTFVDKNLCTKHEIYVDSINSEIFEKKFKNSAQVKRLLFGRENYESKSIFEEILSQEILKYHVSNFDDLLNYIWNEFKLWNIPQILTLKNSLGMRYIDYVFKFCHENQMIQFLNIEYSKIYKGTHKPLKCMMLKSSLRPIKSIKDSTYDAKGTNNNFDGFRVQNFAKTIIDFQCILIKDTKENDDYQYEAHNLSNILYLLEEMHQYCSSNTENNRVIEEVFNYKPTKDFYFLVPKFWFTLGLMMIHWNYYIKIDKDQILIFPSNDEELPELTSICTKNPFLYLISLIVIKKYDQFLKDFPEKIKESVTNYKTSAESKKVDVEHVTTNFCFVFLYGAIKANQKEIVKQMFAFNSFAVNIHEFPSNMNPEEIHEFILKIYLENKSQFGKDVEIPEDWITYKVFKEFLDSRITNQGNFYKINCKFLLPLESQDETLDKKDDNAVFYEDYHTIKYILGSYKLKLLIAHPVMETIVRTKIEKYDRIFFWNLMLFIICYIIPTICIAYILHSDKENAEISEAASRTIISFSAIRLGFLFTREFLQLIAVYGWKKYFKKYSNYIEISLIILCMTTLIIFYISQVTFYNLLTTLESLNIALTVFSTLNLYLIFKFTIHIKCFFMAFKAYFLILCFLLPLSIGAILLIFILFNKPNEGKIEDFHHLNTTIIKYFIMYNGELGINASDLIGIVQIITIAIVIMFAITKSNLILAIVLDDVQKTIRQAKEITLKKNAQKYVDFAEKIEKLYNSYSNALDDSKDRFSWTRLQIRVIRFFIGKYNHIHKINYFHLDKRTRNVYINEQKPLFGHGFFSLKFWRSDVKLIQWLSDFIGLNLKLDSNTFDEIEEIVERKIENEKNEEIDKLNNEIKRMQDEINNLNRATHARSQKGFVPPLNVLNRSKSTT